MDLFVNPLTISPFEQRLAQTPSLRHVPFRINGAPKHLSSTVHLNSRRETSNQPELFSFRPRLHRQWTHTPRQVNCNLVIQFAQLNRVGVGVAIGIGVEKDLFDSDPDTDADPEVAQENRL